MACYHRVSFGLFTLLFGSTIFISLMQSKLLLFSSFADYYRDELLDRNVLPKAPGKFAYAFVVGGCTASSCTGYVLNVIASSQVLKQHNSTADVHFKVRMSADTSDERLPIEHERWLSKAGVHLQYLPKVKVDNFGSITMEKFRVLEMTDYDRVYFLDADILPVCNMDHHMQLSYDGVLQPFVGMQAPFAPLSAGNFIVTPKAGMLEQVLDIVKRNRKNSKKRFSKRQGWGHKIDPKDPWISSKHQGYTWAFRGAPIDQGILYHWMKYEMMDWSHWLMNGTVMSWKEIASNQVSHYESLGIQAFRVKNRYANTKHWIAPVQTIHMPAWSQ